MGQYLISFDEGAMDFPESDLPEVAAAALAVARAAREAGVWVYSAGLRGSEESSVVGTDGSVTRGPYPAGVEQLGGFAVVDVPTRQEALEWAAQIAVACRCAQRVRELLVEPPL